MKRFWVIIVNVLLIFSMLTFVIIYSTYETNKTTKTQIEHFENTTITMEHVTENYLEGEQRICDVWSHYINSENMTIDEAASFIRVSHVLENVSAHIVYADSKTGLSTKPRLGTTDDYSVSYANINLFESVAWIHPLGTSINISRAYTNPANGEQSIAFCNFITLKDGGDTLDGILLRVLPVSELTDKWVFPKEEYETAELSIIDADGDYIIKGHSFKNSSFFEFYKSYNKIDAASADKLFGEITSKTGSFKMLNFRGENCVVSYTPFDATGGWTLISLIPMKDLIVNTQNWLLIGVVSAGLIALFIFDLMVMLYFNKKLKATAKEAESANKAKTVFLSAMSHDIRTPMNAIIGLTTLSEKNIDDKKQVKENLHKIELASNHLLTLINDILDISKVESGKLNFCPQTFSIVETVENLINLSQPMIKEKNINFNFYVNHMVKENLYADQLRLNQIYINLLSNAIKYTEAGGKVSVEMKQEESQKEGCVRLIYKVEDNGIGMSPEFMEKLYQPFSRQTDSRVNKIQGTGLGLAITKQMVDLMEGTIDCQSEQGKGTTFVVTLDIPVSKEQETELSLEKMKVLIIDDNKIALANSKETIESLGLEADVAESEEEAIEKLKNNYIVVLIDLKSQEIEGIKISNRIRNELKLGTPILLMSSFSSSDVEQKAKEAGVNGFIVKPLFRSTVYEKINEVLGKESTSIELENDYSDLAGMNILVAEDNDINWEIISALLEMHGITSERAENGRVCVEKIKAAEEGKYSLIFMDIQMPEMNGLDATREIRSLKDSWASNIPIIAMTADAFAENVTECLDAGMQGHIAKPIDIKLVIKTIRKIKEESK